MEPETNMDLTTNFPRPGEQVLGGYAWLARAIDKARAYNEGTLGDYIYPCPIDKELLAELNVTGEELAEVVERYRTDEEILEHLDIPLENTDPGVERWTREFISNRRDSLTRQAEDEGRTFLTPEWADQIKPFA
jgi:hypothetical protein